MRTNQPRELVQAQLFRGVNAQLGQHGADLLDYVGIDFLVTRSLFLSVIGEQKGKQELKQRACIDRMRLSNVGVCDPR